MLEYFQLFFLQMERGICYILTNLVLVSGAVLLLNDVRGGFKSLLGKAAECLACFAVHSLIVSVYYALFGSMQMDRVCLAIFLLLYSLICSKYKRRVCLVRSCVYFASSVVMLPLSEPLGRVFGDINAAYYQWAQYLTLVVVILMTIAMVLFLRHFAFDTKSVVHPQFSAMTVIISVLTVLSQVASMVMGIYGGFNLIVCAILWLINLLAYYMFYVTGSNIIFGKDAVFHQLFAALAEFILEEIIHTAAGRIAVADIPEAAEPDSVYSRKEYRQFSVKIFFFVRIKKCFVP